MARAPLLRRAKHLAFRAAEATGLNSVMAASRARRDRLLILCYHGVSLADEHEWDPELWITEARLRARLTILRETGCEILRLDDALRRCAGRTLPPRAVALTFDDGFADFAIRAVPVLREFDMPATVYLTTYYCGRRVPIPNLAVPYLVWHARRRGVDLSAFLQRSAIDLTTASSAEKEALVREMADRSGLGYECLLNSRLFQIMSPAEVAALPPALIDVELHTHRHRTPDDPVLLSREIVENREHIARLGHRMPTHFCYPSGRYRVHMLPVLRQQGIHSATTCSPGYVTAGIDTLMTPRFVDTMLTPEAVFRGWVSGAAALLPHRTHRS